MDKKLVILTQGRESDPYDYITYGDKRFILTPHTKYYDTNGQEIEEEDVYHGCTFTNPENYTLKPGMFIDKTPFIAKMKFLGLVSNGSNNNSIFGFMDENKICYSVYPVDIAKIIEREDIVNGEIYSNFKFVSKGCYSAITID